MIAKHLLTLFMLMSMHAYSIEETEKNIDLGLAASKCCKPVVGPPGLPGTDGVSFSGSFLSVFTTLGPPNSITIGSPIPFDQLAIPTQGSAISYDTNGTVTFNETGYYDVTFGISIAAEPYSAGLALQIFPAGIYASTPGFIPGSGFVPGSEIDVIYSNQLTSQSVIIQITAVGQTLQLVNGNSFSPFTLEALSTNTNLTPISGYLVIEKLTN